MAEKVTCITVSSYGTGCQKITKIRTAVPRDLTPAQAHDYVKAYPNSIYCSGAGEIAYLIPATTSGGTKYVRTKPDDTEADNLLKEPRCP